jgi:predicted nucleic-acid-binding protein
MIGIDANVLLRLLLDDDTAQRAQMDAWMSTLPATAGQVHVADVVLAEASWTLASVYRQPKPELLKALRALLAEPMFAFEHRAAVQAAVDAFESAGCGFADCLIVAKNQALRCTGTVSFDQRLGRLAGVSLL